jgi:hypothetical protein
MLRFLALLLVSAGVMACGFAMPAPPPYAMGGPTLPPGPDMPSQIDPAYCESPGADLLASLEGSWSLQQQRGVAWGKTDKGSIGIPLPGHDPAPVVFEYLPELGVMHVQSADLAEEMTMFPATSEQEDAAETLIGAGAGETGGTSGPECDWYDAPLFIGTNFYSGYEVDTQDFGRWLPTCVLMSLLVYNVDPGSCRGLQTPSELELEMEMTLVLRFSDAGNASGMIYFEGTGKETEYSAGMPTETSSEFRAGAPVTLSR